MKSRNHDRGGRVNAVTLGRNARGDSAPPQPAPARPGIYSRIAAMTPDDIARRQMEANEAIFQVGDYVERMTRAQFRRLCRRVDGVHAVLVAVAQAPPGERMSTALRTARLGGRAMPQSRTAVRRLIGRYLEEGAAGLFDRRGCHSKHRRVNPDPRLWLALTACVEAGIPAATAHAVIARFAIEQGRSWPSLRTVQLRHVQRRREVRERNLSAAAHNLN